MFCITWDKFVKGSTSIAIFLLFYFYGLVSVLFLNAIFAFNSDFDYAVDTGAFFSYIVSLLVDTIGSMISKSNELNLQLKQP
jgi:hypothetical protein